LIDFVLGDDEKYVNHNGHKGVQRKILEIEGWNVEKLRAFFLKFSERIPSGWEDSVVSIRRKSAAYSTTGFRYSQFLARGAASGMER